MDDLQRMNRIGSAGMKAQANRLRVIAENLANVDSMAKPPGGDPYRRKVVTFKSVLNQETGVNLVQVDRVEFDRSEFTRRHDPAHPSADANGYTLLPNVNPLVEMMDMREAQRTYEANLNVVSTSREMVRRTLELLR
ncbi:MAG: flagellar basal-body rod protein FlgC [Rhodospirillaceae bacterium]|nr:MAG: flagellar basal-body rod protein FlgC [Rhodospirillaceae bacterium]